MSSRHFTSGSTSGIIFFLFLFLSSADAAFAVNCQWTGMGPDNRWSTAANWALCQGRAPIDGDDLRFVAAVPWPANVNDIPSLEIQLGTGTLTIEQDEAAGFVGTISGSGGLVKNGAGRLVLRRSLFAPGPNTYTGTTTVNAGALDLAHDDNTVCILRPLVVNGGSVLWAGDDEIADTAPVTVNAPGQLFLTGFRDTIGSLSGNGVMHIGRGLGVLSIGGDNSATTFTGTFDAFPVTPGGELLQKVGTGTLTLTGDSMIPGICPKAER